MVFTCTMAIKTGDLPAKFVVVYQLFIVSIALNWNDSRGSTGIPYCSIEIAYFFAVLTEHVCVFRCSLTGHSILFFFHAAGKGRREAVGSAPDHW